ncbi:MAG: SDR family oxidoreductase [Chloroflexota bacterium]
MTAADPGPAASRGALVVSAPGASRAVAEAIGAALAAAGYAVRRGPVDGPAEDLVPGVPAGTRVVVHVAAPSTPRAFLDRDPAGWTAELEARIAAPIRLARAAAPVLAATGGGALVFVGTLDATHAYPGHADASVAMGALGGLVRSLAVELAPLGVRANAVLAGPFEPDVAPPAAGATGGGAADPSRVARTLLRSPSGRFVAPGEVAAAVAFVAGEGAAFMTGASLRVDGGWASLNQAPDGMRFP